MIEPAKLHITIAKKKAKNNKQTEQTSKNNNRETRKYRGSAVERSRNHS